MPWKEQFVELLFPFDASKALVDQAFYLKYQHLPHRLYKYRDGGSRSKQNLREGTIWLADPETFNDPYDCAHAVDLARMGQELLRNPPAELMEKIPKDKIASGILDRLKSSFKPWDTLLEEMLSDGNIQSPAGAKAALASAFGAMNERIARSLIARMKAAFRLCSFSARVDLPLMWAHYADYHKGFCIEYDIRALNPEECVSRFMYPVIYSDIPFDLTDYYLRGVEHPEFYNLYPNQMGLRKASEWAYEQEWRLIFSNGIVKEPRAYPMPKPSMVYLGSHATREDQAEVLDICEELGVPVKKMKHSVNEYRMSATSLEELEPMRVFARA